MKKGKRKLSAQIAFMLVTLQIIVIAVLSTVIYKSTVNTYLTAKNDIIGYWLDASRDYILSDPATLWALDYWTKHPEETRSALSADEENSELLEYLYTNVYAAAPEEKISNLENASEEIQLFVAQHLYKDFIFSFDSSDLGKYRVRDIGCFRLDDGGNIFVYCSKDINGQVI